MNRWSLKTVRARVGLDSYSIWITGVYDYCRDRVVLPLRLSDEDMVGIYTQLLYEEGHIG